HAHTHTHTHLFLQGWFPYGIWFWFWNVALHSSHLRPSNAASRLWARCQRWADGLTAPPFSANPALPAPLPTCPAAKLPYHCTPPPPLNPPTARPPLPCYNTD